MQRPSRMPGSVPALVVTIAALAAFGCTNRRTKFAPSQEQPAQPGAQQGQPGNQPTGPVLPEAPVTPEGPGGPPPATVDPNGTPTGPGTTPETPDTPPATPPTTPTTPEEPPTPPPPAPATPNADGTLEVSGQTVKFQDMTITIPSGWTLHQETVSDGILLAGFARGNDYVRYYAKKQLGMNMQQIFVNGSQSAGERSESAGGRDWKRLDATKGQVQISAFMVEHNGYTYYGFARGTSPAAAATEFLNATK